MQKDKRIKGVNLGSWLLMEGYILGGRNIPESQFKKSFEKIYGEKGLKGFEKTFRDNFIKEEDFKRISLIGASAMRLPFNCRLIEKKPFVYSEEGFSYLSRALSWAKKYGLGVILDLHAAYGAQNCDWHGDSCGEALLWEKKPYRERTYSLWEAIASKFKNHPSLIGYDVLNEPVLGRRSLSMLKEFYSKTIKRIRGIDKESLIFIEGNNWGQDVDFLEDLIGNNIVISIHTYAPLNYTFNFTPFYKFPGVIDNVLWNIGKVHKYLEPYAKFSRNHKARIYVGEFGINWRGGFFGEIDWLKAMLDTFEEFGFDYTYWTYKAVSQHCFPDGIYQYIPDNDYIKREGPVFGWENYLGLWGTQKNKVTDFWQTKNYTPNQEIISILKKFFAKR